jgi:hypothetical protein
MMPASLLKTVALKRSSMAPFADGHDHDAPGATVIRWWGRPHSRMILSHVVFFTDAWSEKVLGLGSRLTTRIVELSSRFPGLSGLAER